MKKTILVLKAEVVLGNPKIQCDGYGICKIVIKNTLIHKPRLCALTVDADIYVKNNLLCISFQKSTMSPIVHRKYFSKGFFVMESDFVLPFAIKKSLGHPPSVLRQGKYKVYDTAQQLCIAIPIYYKTASQGLAYRSLTFLQLNLN